MKISIVIPNYNGKKLLEKNLPQVVKVTEDYPEICEIIITDDHSTDGSIPFIEEVINLTKFKSIKIKLIKSDENAGFSTNANKGAKAAVGEVIILLNTDVVPEKDFLLPLIEHFKDPLVFAVGCMDKSIENGKIILRGRGTGKWEKGFLIHKAGSLDKKNTLWVSGGSSAFRKSIWKKLRGLDPLYNPFYWEDIDLSYRALKAGYKVIFEKSSIVIHEHEKGSIRSQYSEKKIKTISYRNQFIFVWKNAQLSLLTSHIFWLPIHLIHALKRRDMVFFAGFWHAIIMLPKIICSRQVYSRYNMKNDTLVIQELKIN